jgi:hypothetical protein
MYARVFVCLCMCVCVCVFVCIFVFLFSQCVKPQTYAPFCLGVYEEEKRTAGSFQVIPFYYLELAQTLFRETPCDTFGEENFAKVGLGLDTGAKCYSCCHDDSQSTS